MTMKRLARQSLLVLLTLLLVLGIHATALAEDSANLLQNPGFEELDEDGMPVGWKTDAYLNLEGITFYSASDDAVTGEYSAQIENLDYNDARFSQTVAVEPNSFYRLSGYIKAWDTLDEGLGGNLSIKDVYVFSESVYDSQDDWVYVEMYGVTNTNQRELTVFARLGGYSGESIGVARIDDLSLVKVDAPPEGIVAERWYTSPNTAAQTEAAASASPAWPWMTALAIAYLAVGAYVLFALQRKQAAQHDLQAKQAEKMPLFVVLGLIVAAVARLLVANAVSGYQVDVNCFLSWGNTLLSVGPAEFYQTTNFCDYPPAYVYIMGLNAALAKVLPWLSAAAVHKLLPMLCDLLAAYLVYRIARKKQASANQAGALCLLMAFNPAIFLNSAGWCQIDSVLSLLLMLVAYFAVCGQWVLVMPIYMLAVLVKPQALMMGFLGLAAIVMAIIRDRKVWKPMLIGVGAAVAVAVVVVLPFSIHQGGIAWLIDKYAQTLSSYPYATVNTANFYYLFNCNWRAIVLEAPVTIPLVLMVLAAVWTAYLAQRAKQEQHGWMPDTLTGLAALLLIAGGFGLGGFFATQSGWTRVMLFRFGGSVTMTRTALLIIGLLGLAGAAGLGAWLFKRKKTDWNSAEIAAGLTFALIFLALATFNASFTMIGVVTMTMAFVMVLPMFIRGGKLENLALCGGVLFLLLYVFGIKMHERYLFPALFLLGMAYAARRDSRTLLLLLGLSATVFVNEGIVLDNSLRLGSSLGHLNNDTYVLAMLLSAANVALALLGVWTCRDVCLPVRETEENAAHRVYFPVKRLGKNPADPRTFQQDTSLHWHGRDWALMLGLTLVYAVVALTNLGSMKAPQNPWKSSNINEQVVIDLGAHYDDVTMLYYCQVSYSDFSIAVSDDAENWSDEYWAQMAEGQCFQWKYLVPSYTSGGKHYYTGTRMKESVQRLSGRYIRVTAQQVGLTVNELIFRDANDNVIPAKVIAQLNARENSPLYSDANALLDEQDTLEGEPSWWNGTYFDEIYHARTAYEHLHGTAPYETSHPPLGKVIMSLGVAIFGMVPFGWRVMGALAGILMLPVMYLLGKQLTKKSSFAFAAAAMLALDCQHFTQTRIATIDSYPVLFILLSWLFMLRFMQRDIVRTPVKKLLPDLALSGLFMGCGIASKWIGVYSGAGLGVVFFWTIFRHMRMATASAKLLKTEKNLTDEEKEILTLRDRTTMKRVLVLCLWCVLFFIVVPLAIYLLAYIPYFAYAHFDNLKDYLTAVWNAQMGMFNYHSQPGLGMDHPFYSPWYEWIFNKRPMYYASSSYVTTSGWNYALWCFGNPAIWSAALVGFAYTVFAWAKRHRYTLRDGGETLHLTACDWDVTTPFLLIGALSQLLPWVIVPRGTYIYHYFATTPFLMLGVAVMFKDIARRFPKAGKWLLGVFLVVCLGMFVAYFPYASGVLTPTWWLDFMKQFLRIYY